MHGCGQEMINGKNFNNNNSGEFVLLGILGL